MKDLELIIPYLREFLDERGLNDARITIVIDNLGIEDVNGTHANCVTTTETLYSDRKYLSKKIDGKDTIIFQSKLFNQ